MVICDAFAGTGSWGQESFGIFRMVRWVRVGMGMVNGNQGLGMGRMNRCLG